MPSPGQPQATTPAPASSEPAWTPPQPPQPSQTHIPTPFQPSPVALRAPLELRKTVGVSGEYTDNFRLSSTSRTDNFRSTLSAGLTLFVSGARTEGSISAILAGSHDTASDDLSFFPTANASIRYALDPRLSFTFTDTFTRSDEATQADELGLRRERRTFVSNSLSLSADWLLDLVATQGYYRLFTFFSGSDTISHVLGVNASVPVALRTLVRGGYELSLADTSGDTSRESTGHLLFASVSQQIGQFATAGLSGSYSMQSFDGTRIWNLSLFGAYGLPAGLSLSGSVGYSVLSADNVSDQSTVSANFAASYRFANAVISLAIVQDMRQTFVEGEDFGVVISRSYTGSISYPFTPFIRGSLRAAYSENDFTGVGNRRGDRAANILTLGADVTWDVLRWLSMAVGYVYTERTGSSRATDTTENRASVKLTATF